MSIATDNQGLRSGTASRLRLIHSVGARTAPRSKTRWMVSTIACPSGLSWFTKRGNTHAASIDQERRPRGRPQQEEKGIIKKTKDSLIADVSRFVFGLGIGLALTSAYVVVTSAPDLLGAPAATDIVRLDPVVVTISSKRFDEIRAEADVPATKMHVYGAGAPQV